MRKLLVAVLVIVALVTIVGCDGDASGGVNGNSDAKPDIYGNAYMHIYRHINLDHYYAKNLLKTNYNRKGWINKALNIDLKCTDYQYTEKNLLGDIVIANMEMKTYIKNDDSDTAGSCYEYIYQSDHGLYGDGTIVQSYEY